MKYQDRSNKINSIQNNYDYDAIVVGAGFGGLYMLHRLREKGYNAIIVEAADEVGGTWYWNRYPGARCDSESYNYVFTFSQELLQEWRWSERYATQSEILDYLKFVAERLDLVKDIRFNSKVTSAKYNDATNGWAITINDKDQITSKFFITAVGNLTAANIPNIPGINDFKGKWYHTAKWPKEGVNFSGQTVGVIGTGASGVQVIPEIAKQAKHLTVFQRTPNYLTPANNRLITEEEDKQIKQNYEQRIEKMRYSHAGYPYRTRGKKALDASKEERNKVYEELWNIGSFEFLYSFGDITFNKEANETVAEFIRAKIHETVDNPKVADILTPKDYPYASKRPLLDWNYYETFNRENVNLVDVKKNPIKKITPTGIETSAGHFELDSIVFATGFDAITGALMNIDIYGKNGTSLKEKWKEYPSTFLGFAIHDFPNMFMITGPGSPLPLVNAPIIIEQNVEWILNTILYADENSISSIEARREYEQWWMEEVQKAVNSSLIGLADTWYNGKNIEGKPNHFIPYTGGFRKYREMCDNVIANKFKEFIMSKSKNYIS